MAIFKAVYRDGSIKRFLLEDIPGMNFSDVKLVKVDMTDWSDTPEGDDDPIVAATGGEADPGEGTADPDPEADPVIMDPVGSQLSSDPTRKSLDSQK